ncbi:MAG: fasciclin domain-containing protein, partial [Gemmatimonadetes bacterium]|nr:fasciclin domain-containing protein [Gemmatimonadota bacterium]
NGKDVTVAVKSGKVMINNATVVTPDIKASNGIIHVIDTVLLPE